MPKKRRSDSVGNPSSDRKNKYEKEADVTTARHRLTGVLQELLNSDEESSSSQDEAPKETAVKKEVKVTVRRRKRKAPLDLDLKFQHTFVMKMYDRSVDLAQFCEDTPLYPICRAWIANKPRTLPEPIPVKDETEVKTEQGVTYDFDAEIVPNVDKMPLPSAPALGSRIPPPSAPQLQGVCLDYGEDLPSAQDLLEGHRKRWSKVKKNWSEACMKNESRFALSGKILTHIHKKNGQHPTQ